VGPAPHRGRLAAGYAPSVDAIHMHSDMIHATYRRVRNMKNIGTM